MWDSSLAQEELLGRILVCSLVQEELLGPRRAQGPDQGFKRAKEEVLGRIGPDLGFKLGPRRALGPDLGFKLGQEELLGRI